MKHFLTFFILGFSTIVTAAESISPWSDIWKISVSDAGCSLQRDFSSERAQEVKIYSGYEYELFDRFFVWFYIPSHTRKMLDGMTYLENELYLSIYSQVYPKVREDQQRIDSVHINGVEIDRPNKSEFTSYRQYIVHGQGAHDILELLENEEAVIIDLGLSGGEIESVWVPSNSEQRFSVWSKLLFVCAEEIAATP